MYGESDNGTSSFSYDSSTNRMNISNPLPGQNPEQSTILYVREVNGKYSLTGNQSNIVWQTL